MGKRAIWPVSSAIVCAKYRPDAIDREQLLGGWRLYQTLADGLFQRFDLLAQTVKDGQAAGDGQDLIGIRKQGPQLLRCQLAKPLELTREPVLRTMIFWTLSTLEVC